jgi:hypothetical protein
MLGFENKKPFVVTGKYAKELREKLRRYRTGEFNEEDLRQMERSKKILSKYNAIWKD